MNNGKPRIEIEYCVQCKWMLRAAWMMQELLSTFEAELGGVTLVPGSGGVFEVRVTPAVESHPTEADGTSEPTTLWSRAAEGRFPDIKELKQRVRDRIAPGRDLGHVDR